MLQADMPTQRRSAPAAFKTNDIILVYGLPDRHGWPWLLGLRELTKGPKRLVDAADKPRQV
jgi:hypothetical protein